MQTTFTPFYKLQDDYILAFRIHLKENWDNGIFCSMIFQTLNKTYDH